MYKNCKEHPIIDYILKNGQKNDIINSFSLKSEMLITLADLQEWIYISEQKFSENCQKRGKNAFFI